MSSQNRAYRPLYKILQMSTLSVLIETSSCSWGKLSYEHGDRTIGIVLRSLVSFCNAHLAQSASNQLLVFAYGNKIDKNMVYSSTRSEDRDFSTLIIQRLRDILLSEPGAENSGKGAFLGPALAHAFCHMKKNTKLPSIDPCADSLGPQNVSLGDTSDATDVTVVNRAVVISITPITGSEHGSLMNLFFSAAKQSIYVDVVSLGEDATGGVLQQAADITGGIFLHVEKPESLLKKLMTNMLSDPTYRSTFFKPSINTVDYRASCACHQRMVSAGWVCSVCLSVLCQYTPICKVCKAVFTISSLPKKFRRKRVFNC